MFALMPDQDTMDKERDEKENERMKKGNLNIMLAGLAAIYVDGRRIKDARTPETFDVPAGKRRFRAELNGISEEKELNVKRNKTIKISFDLSPRVGKLTVLSKPSGAAVYINHEKVGTTPLTKELDVGNYNLTIKLNNISRQRMVQIINKRTTKEYFDLSPKYGWINIVSDPKNASAYLDSEYLGRTPFNKKIETGNYNLNPPSF